MPYKAGGNYEKLEHTVYGGEVQNVPLYVDHERGLTEQSNGLLHAANIIGGSLRTLFDNDVSRLMERVASVLQDDDRPYLIEDEDGAGSVALHKDISRISVRSIGVWEVPTTMVFDMLYVWSEMADKKPPTE